MQAALPGTWAGECTYGDGETFFFCTGDTLSPATWADLSPATALKLFSVHKVDSVEFDFPPSNPEDYLKNVETMLILESNVTSFEPIAGSLENLKVLVVSGGSVSNVSTDLTAIATLTSLVSLQLSDFVGLQNTSIPDAVAALTSLTRLNLVGLGLTGPLPQIGALSDLTSIELDGNNFVGGCIPASYEGSIDIPFSECLLPTANPTATPSKAPTKFPTTSPTKLPSTSPSKSPSVLPSTEAPTDVPEIDIEASQLPLLIGSAAGGLCLVMLVAFGLWKCHKKTNKQTSGSLMSQPAVDRETGRNKETEKKEGKRKKKEEEAEQRVTVAKDEENTVFDPIKGWVAGADPGGKTHAPRAPPKK